MVAVGTPQEHDGRRHHRRRTGRGASRTASAWRCAAPTGSSRCRRSWLASSTNCGFADPYDPSPSVVIISGAEPCFLMSLRMSLTAARVSRRVCTRTSSTSPSSSTARQSQCRLPAIVFNISSRCHRAVGRGRRLRRSRANSGPNLQTQRRTVSQLRSRPRSASMSSTSRRLSVKRRQS